MRHEDVIWKDTVAAPPRKWTKALGVPFGRMRQLPQSSSCQESTWMPGGRRSAWTLVSCLRERRGILKDGFGALFDRMRRVD